MVTATEEKTIELQEQIITFLKMYFTEKELQLLKGHELHFEDKEIYFM